MRVIITGCRRWEPWGLAEEVLNRLLARHGPDVTIVQGAATGVDYVFVETAYDLGIGVCSYPADWERHGKRAGPLRNAEMVAAGADLCLAVHRDIRDSKGTRGCALLAMEAGIPAYLIDSDELPSRPRRLSPDDLA